MKFILPVIILLATISCSGHGPERKISTVSLLNEMADLHRLTNVTEANYRTIQFSSYDRRSTKPTDSCWFSNEDGFGNEPVPALMEVLKKPVKDGTGEYLICDIRQPGAIMRLWTAGINGRIRLFLDDIRSPVYDGDAQEFFWKTVEKLSGKYNIPEYSGIFRQFDASYFPIPFSKRCRIEWTGDISKIHFYHVGMRIYDKDVEVETFNPSEFEKYSPVILRVNELMKNPETIGFSKDGRVESFESELTDSLKKEIFFLRGTGAIENLSFRITAGDIENALRESILNIYFDGSSIPQIQAPLGDFFGSAPGFNSYQSVPFGVLEDSTLVCRFIMPYKTSVRIEVENYSGRDIKLKGSVRIAARKWEDGNSMHFRARWKIDHGLTASGFDSRTNDIQDIIYLMASGRGRIVGSAAFIYNPSNATTSWGNWWGEGDEKIFVDRDTFPSFFGTGSEDYFNYSWSSQKIFSYPYCGQTRNDGPGNRGYVSDYRWHISDDIPFSDKLAFYMELGHHGIVPGFSYGRIVYFYALPGTLDDYRKISIPDIKHLPYIKWDPIAYLGSAGYRYIQAEKLIAASSSVKIEKGKLWAGGSIVMWKPLKKGERINFNISSGTAAENAIIGLTLSHNPDGGTIAVAINGKKVKFDGNASINLYEPVQTILANHFSEQTALKKGTNEVTIEFPDEEKDKKIGIDFIWVKEF
jgi:hypothetical protein